MKKLIILTKSQFPDCDAMSIRFVNLISLFKTQGCDDINVFDYGHNKYNEMREYDGYKAFSLRRFDFKPSILSKLLSRINFEKRYISKVENVISKETIVLIAGNFSLKTIRKINAIAKTKDSKVIVSMTEKYSDSEIGNSFALREELRINKQIYNDYNNSDPSVICISNYMKKCFDQSGVKTCVIPFVFQKDYIPYQSRILSNEKIVFSYIGRPSNKDMLIEMIKAFLLLDETVLSRIELRIAGASSKWIQQSFNEEDRTKLSKFLTVLGNVKYGDVGDVYKSSHFTILLRPKDAEYANAGFPTKITESLFYGVPPVTNLTSDLHLYLKDNFNSIVCDGDTIEAFKKAIKRAFEFAVRSTKEYFKMSENARLIALNSLETSCFIKELKKVL